MAGSTLFLSRRLVLEAGETDGGLLVRDGLIHQLLTRAEADKLRAESSDDVKVVDVGELALMAGVVDSHVHVNEPGRTAWEGFRTATLAAAAGGITTIVDMPLNSIPPTTTLENLRTKASSAKGNVYIDVGFWGGVIPGNEEHLRELVDAGVVGFKCFLCPSGVEEFPHVEARHLEKAFNALEGTGSVLAFHAELEDDDEPRKQKTKKGDPEEYNTYLESRPAEMEVNAVKLITKLLPKTDVRVHIVHVSCAGVVPLLEAARRARGAAAAAAWRGGVTAETCHHYLTLHAGAVPRARSDYKCAPPIRDKQNQEKLWKYLLEDKLNLVVSDHSPCTPDLKCTNNLEAWGGISSVQFGLSLFWSGACERGVDLATASRLLSAAPARLCGFDNKGSLAPGRHADIVVFDPDDTFTVTQDIIRHKNKLTPYIGRELRGVVKQTYLRGKLIYSDGEINGEPSGTLLLNKSVC